MGRFDTALLDINARNSYLDALKLKKVKVEQNKFWSRNFRKGMLKWLISRNIWVISWESAFPIFPFNDTLLKALVIGFFQSLSRLNTIVPSSGCRNIIDDGIKALS